jgi:signal transduction protein with GAF and PtsI domain
MTRRAPLRDAAVIAATVADTIRLRASDEALHALCEATRLAFGAAEVSIARVDSTTAELVYEAASGNAAYRIIGVRLPLGRGLAGYAAVANETLAIEQVTSDPRFARDVAERTGYVPEAMVLAPIATGDAVLGVLSILDRTQPEAQAALQLAAAFARAAAGALEVQHAARSLSVTVFGAAARAAADEADRPDVAATLDALADTAPDDDLAVLARSLAALRDLPAADRALAERLVAEIVRHGRASRPGRTRR